MFLLPSLPTPLLLHFTAASVLLIFYNWYSFHTEFYPEVNPDQVWLDLCLDDDDANLQGGRGDVAVPVPVPVQPRGQVRAHPQTQTRARGR